MYTTRVIDKNEKDIFNNFVTAHPRGHFLQLWEWGQVKKGMGWESLPLIVEQDGTIEASMLILKRRIPLPGLNKCIFYSPRGPVVDADNEELCAVLFEGARKVARENGAIFLKIDPDVPTGDEQLGKVLLKNGLKKNDTGLDFDGVQPRFVFRLNLKPSEIALLDNMHNKWRYNIRLASRKGVVIRPGEDKADLALFYDILQETAQRDQFLIRGYEYFEWIWDYMVESGFAKLFLAEYEGEIIAATLAMISGEKVWYLYGASSNRQRNLMPNYLIQWEMIRWAREQGCTLYDFRGVSGDLNEDNPLYGLYRFKKGFGGEFTEFIGEWDQIYSPVFYWMFNHVLPIYLKARRR